MPLNNYNSSRKLSLRLSSGFVGVALILMGEMITAHAKEGLPQPDPSVVKGPNSSIRLLFGGETRTAKARNVQIGIEVRLKPGWKIFWRSPGESGAPPHFDWKGSTGVGIGRIGWPRPINFTAFGLTSWGYKDIVVFPVNLRIPVTSKTVAGKERDKPVLKLHFQYQVCKDICIPASARFTRDISVPSSRKTEQSKQVRRFAAMVPSAASAAGIRASAVSIYQKGKKGIAITLASDRQDLSQARIIIEAPRGLGIGPSARKAIKSAKMVARFFAPARLADAKSAKPVPLIITILFPTKAFEARMASQ